MRRLVFSKPKTKSNNALEDLDPLYHEYSFFGVNNYQTQGHFVGNQKAKAPIITAYIAMAIAKAKELGDNVSFAELFCADGYYAMVASRVGATKCYGIDNDFSKQGYAQKVEQIAKRLGVENVEYIDEDINNIHQLPKVDIVANVGGLYHVSNPGIILAKSYRMAKKYLVVQTVVSMESDDENYFETPAPGWSWGCRFSHQYIDKLIRDRSYNVVDQHFNELKGNTRLHDKGSVYYLIKK